MDPNTLLSSPDPKHQLTAPVTAAESKSSSRTQIQQAQFQGSVYMGADGPVNTLDAYRRSLSFPEMYSRYYSITSTSENATSMWLANCEEYETWQNDGGLLWLKGKPASGKSTLMRYVFEKSKSTDGLTQDAEDQHENTDNQTQFPHGKNLEIKKSITLSFFFHGRGSSLQKTMLGFYRTLLFQLLEEQSNRKEKITALAKLEESFQCQYDSRGPPGNSWQWETSQLAQDFQSVLSEILKDHLVYLYVDALDECGEDDARRLAETFERMVQKSPIKRFKRKIDDFTGEEIEDPVGKRLHICCSCRNFPLLVKAMVKDTFRICVDSHNQQGIESYVWAQLDETFSQNISKTITKRSNGVFMWAYLVVERVKNLYSRGFTKKEIEASIDQTPQNLKDLYEDLLQKMLGNEDSLRLLYWILYAQKELNCEELRWAMFLETNPKVMSLQELKEARNYPCDCADYMKCTCKVMERRVRSLGHGFVEMKVQDGIRVVDFIHQSAKDFFLKEDALVRLYNKNSKSDSEDYEHVVKKVKKSIVATCARYNRMMKVIGMDSSLSSKMEHGIRMSLFSSLHHAVTPGGKE